MTEDDAAEPEAPADPEAPAEPEPTPEAAPGRPGSAALRAAAAVLVVVALALGWTAWRHHTTASVPGRGACVYAEGATGRSPKLHSVDCSDTRARYTVLTRIDGGAPKDCDRVSGADASYASTRDGRAQYVLCLALR